MTEIRAGGGGIDAPANYHSEEMEQAVLSAARGWGRTACRMAFAKKRRESARQSEVGWISVTGKL